MVIDKTKAIILISDWIRDQIDGAGMQSAVVGLSGGADSALVALLCTRAVGLEHTYVVKMPCGSSPSSLERADELIKKFRLRELHVDLNFSFESIRGQVNVGLGDEVPTTNGCEGALRSCLRAPVLDYVAKRVHGLVVGTGNRDEDEVTRYYQKRGDGAVDISPIARLHKSEVYELLAELGCPKSIMEATPTADLWGPDSGQEDEKEIGLTYFQVEWGIRVLNDLLGWQPCASDIEKMRRVFSTSQFAVLKRLIELEEASRHKAMLPPVFDIRGYEDVVK